MKHPSRNVAFTKVRRATPWLAAVGLACLTMSCASLRRPKPQPFAAPPVTVSARAFAGTPLSGPTAVAVTIPPPQQTWRVRVTLTAVDRPLDGSGSSLGAKAALIVASRGAEPVSASDRLLRGARWVDGTADVSAAGGNSAVIDDRAAALVAGTTLAIAADDPIDAVDPVLGGRAHRRVGVMIYRPRPSPAANAADFRVAIEFQDLYAPPPAHLLADEGTGKGSAAAPTTGPTATARPSAVETLPPTSTPTLTRELAVVDRTLRNDADAFTLLLPLSFSGSAAKAIVARVEVHASPTDTDQGELVAAAEKELLRSRTTAARQPAVTAFGAAAASAVDVAMTSLDDPAQRRKGLVYLAGEVGAPLCEDAALVADDASLAAIADAAQRAVWSAASPRPAGAALGWLLDRATFGVLDQQLAAERLSPELAAVLTAYAGEAGRHAASVDIVAKAAPNGREAFDAQLVAENLIFLEDNSPASRVRAYDWLAGRRLAPAGYKPLDPAKARRVALDRAFNPPAATAPAAKPVPPATQPSRAPNVSTAGGQP